MTNYPLIIPAGATVSVNTQNNFVYYESASAGGVDTSIKVVTDGGNEFILKVGQGARLQNSFKSLYVSNLMGQGTIIGNLVLSDGDFVDHRVVGTVSVISGELARTDAGIAFFGVTLPGAAAANYSAAQLWNPITSGVALVLTSLTVSSSVASVMQLSTFASAFSQIDGTNPNGTCKKAGAAVSKAEIRFDRLPALTGSRLHQLSISPNLSCRLQLIEPILLAPGYGAHVMQTVPNTDLTVNFEYWQR